MNLDWVRNIKMTHKPPVSIRTKKSEAENIPGDGDLTRAWGRPALQTHDSRSQGNWTFVDQMIFIRWHFNKISATNGLEGKETRRGLASKPLPQGLKVNCNHSHSFWTLQVRTLGLQEKLCLPGVGIKMGSGTLSLIKFVLGNSISETLSTQGLLNKALLGTRNLCGKKGILDAPKYLRKPYTVSAGAPESGYKVSNHSPPVSIHTVMCIWLDGIGT